jgi:soluble lytic murein transglycosylase
MVRAAGGAVEGNNLARFAWAAVAAALLAGSSAFAQSSGTGDVRVLSDSDVRLYRDIMADERAGHFRDAQSDFDRLSDTSLKGYALAEHYLSRRAKRVPVAQLVNWLRDYSELPVAERVYRLAVKRSTKRVRRHHHTVLVAVVTNIPVPAPPARRRGGGYEDVEFSDPPLMSQPARTALPAIEQSIRADQPDLAHAQLASVVAQNAPAVDIARLAHRIAASYLAESMDDKAYALANNIADLEKRSVPMLYWDAGLAAYRLGKFDDAAIQFEALANSGSVPNWTRSAAAFWAARSYLQTGNPQKVVTLLELAAKSQPTFYGLISERLLGEDTETGFSEPTVKAQDFAELMRSPAAHRAVALWQIGDRADAAIELNRAFGESDTRLDATFSAIAHKIDVPNLELRASESCASRGIMLTGLFPVPGYRPAGGYEIDPSLVLAFARIESRFQPEATSPVGARGLMQIMPGTAAHLAGSGAAARLYDASYNLSLGQRYIEELLNQLNGNLFELAAAYNAGPSALTRWLGTKGGQLDDPLLFIESMPVPETRAYVKRMMTYHWMYRRRMGRDAKSLDDTAVGNWPVYRAAEQSLPSQPVAPPPPAANPAPVSTTVVSDAQPSS